MPFAVALLGDARLAGIQQIKGRNDGIADSALRLEVDLVSGLPGLFDGVLKIGHGSVLLREPVAVEPSSGLSATFSHPEDGRRHIGSSAFARGKAMGEGGRQAG